MPKANYRFEKRQKELKKKQRKQEKGKRKAELKVAAGGTTVAPASDNVDTTPV